jgi:phosphoribosylamine--glycine ligase
MKIAIIGSGGREHAIGWKLAAESGDHDLLFLPGNPGTSGLGTNVEIGAADVAAITSFAAEARPDLVIVGPEGPLAAGLADRLREAGIKVFGPGQAAAKIESSKIFAKELMSKYGIPTAPYKVFTEASRAHDYVEKAARPLVVKADGLARGKGAVVAKEKAQAHEAVERMMNRRVFGEAGAAVVIEERLRGEEVSVVAITDGEKCVVLPPAQDHKAVFDRDRGPNTGGMGAYAPAPLVDESTMRRVEGSILRRLLRGLTEEGLEYRGVIYAGLMINADGVFVIEFNARFGDPETQAMLPAVDVALGQIMLDAAGGRLKRNQTVKSARWAVCVVAASGGYPDAYETGMEIAGLASAAAESDVLIFHAGTRRLDDGRLVTSGGRVLGVTGTGSTLREARRKAYDACRLVRFKGKHMRMDVGVKGLRRLRSAGVTES